MSEDFGCAACYRDDDPYAARELYVSGTERVATLHDESHFLVALDRCPQCAQSFVLVFTESIDWVGGQDPQDTVIAPVTEEEAARFVAQGNAFDPWELEKLPSGRRLLISEWPSGSQKQIRWGFGSVAIAEPR